MMQFLSPPASFEDQVISHNNIVKEITRKVGKMNDLAYKSTYNPGTKKYSASRTATCRPGDLATRPLERRRAGRRRRGSACGSPRRS
jgi:hypothetical protein